MNFILNFAKEWLRLLELPFRRAELAGPTFRKLYAILSKKKLKDETDRLRAYIIKQWLLVPFSLWPADFLGMGKFVADQLAEGHALSEQMVFLLDGLDRFPLPSAQEIVAAQERRVETGDYSRFLTNPLKFATKQLELVNNMELQRRWRRFKELFDVVKYRDADGINRRTMLMERNDRPESWVFDGKNPYSVYLTALNCLCEEFDLYGFDGDRPLLLKPTVTITAYGTLIMIPKYMSYDARRDLVTKAVSEAHNVHERKRQGSKWNITRQQNSMKAARTFLANEKALKAGLEGEARRLEVIKEAKLDPNTDLRIIRELSRIGAALFEVK
ncbi:MAG: hypothetical protein H0X66_09220 [Verrucomicrobia bacterium]|nr:hypothetical protein [Verrucomicrobiota bacterium]